VSDCLPARLRISAQIPTPVKQQVRRAPSSLSPSIHAFAELFGWPLDGSVNPRPRVLVNHEGVILRRLTRLEVILCQTICQCAERVGGADAHNFNLQGNCSLLGLAHVVKEGTPGAIPISNGRVGSLTLRSISPTKIEILCVTAGVIGFSSNQSTLLIRREPDMTNSTPHFELILSVVDLRNFQHFSRLLRCSCF